MCRMIHKMAAPRWSGDGRFALGWILVGWSFVVLPSFAMALEFDEPPFELETLKPGLLTVYRAGGLDWHAVEAKPAVYLVDSSRHPRLPVEAFQVQWSGCIHVREDEAIRFGACVAGSVTVEIGDELVFQAEGNDPNTHRSGDASWRREPGFHRIRIRFRSNGSSPARLQLTWEGESFAREPIPAWRFFHRESERSRELRDDEQAERGRTLAESLGCKGCHAKAFPSATADAAGPSLAGCEQRMSREWIASWLADPRQHHPQSRMPRLFRDDDTGRAERWLIAEFLGKRARGDEARRDPRPGRLAFVGLGCFACHPLPDETKVDGTDESDLPSRRSLIGLSGRFRFEDLVTFLLQPRDRYADGRMPRFPLTQRQAEDLASYLLYWSVQEAGKEQPPGDPSIHEVMRRLGVSDRTEAARRLIDEKRCAACHPGLPVPAIVEVPLRRREGGCLTGEGGPRFHWGNEQADVARYLQFAEREVHHSPYFERERRLEKAGCVRCHQRDSQQPPPIERWGARLGGAFLQEVPYQRTPRLHQPLQKYRRSYLGQAIRDGVQGVRSERYTYRMPAFGAEAGDFVRALAESDGEPADAPEGPDPAIPDPTLGSVAGPILAGSQGYSCISCHAWNGKHLVAADPGAAGPDLARTTDRLRREWFDRFLDDPQRSHPGTPMPAAFRRGEPAPLGQILDGQAGRQKEALWAYFAAAKHAPPPRPSPSVSIEAPALGTPPLAAVIPLHLEDGSIVESISVLWPSADLLVYDLDSMAPREVRLGAVISRSVQGRLRRFHVVGRVVDRLTLPPSPRFSVGGRDVETPRRSYQKFEILADGARLEWRCSWENAAPVVIRETFRLQDRTLEHDLSFEHVPVGVMVEVHGQRQSPDAQGRLESRKRFVLPPSELPPVWQEKSLAPVDRAEGSLIRPGYRATPFPRPKLVSGEDRVMPVAIAAHPRQDRVFVASWKTGEVFRVHDPEDRTEREVFERIGPTLFADAFSMACDDGGLFILHRRNLSRWDWERQTLERMALIPHGVADSYDYAYGLTRDRSGAWVYSLAPYAHQTLPGSGGAVRQRAGREPEAFAFGFRNPLGWCAGPEGEIFCTDNQGEWVPANKLCHVVDGRYYGFPNPKQPEHRQKTVGRAAVYVPYAWAHSINGVAFDSTQGKFGPFVGQFFLAELMFGGAIIRADVEKVNGEYQGACFPFWGKGLLGPVSLAFDARGRLFVGGITEPGWMAQPDRGQLFRIDYTGDMPFEMRTIRIRPKGFRIEFTQPVDPATASDPRSYRVEYFRYEISGAYGSPELDRTSQPVLAVRVAEDRTSVDLTLAGVLADRVYMVEAGGVRSGEGKPLVHAVGAYTVNQVPRK